MHGGEISGNRTNFGMGGGVYNGNPSYEGDGLFVITGGVVYGTEEPPGFAGPGSWDNYKNEDNGGRGGAFYILGGTVAWGRMGYYYLDENDHIAFKEDRRYYEEDKRGEPFVADISIGMPTIDPLYWGKDENGNDKYIPNIMMNEAYAKLDTNNDTIRVDPDDGVYINGIRKEDFNK
jgi:hypothetical protein